MADTDLPSALGIDLRAEFHTMRKDLGHYHDDFATAGALQHVLEKAYAAGQASVHGTVEVYGFWNYRHPWTPDATAEMIPLSAADVAGLKGSRERLYRAYRTPWQPVEEASHG